VKDLPEHTLTTRLLHLGLAVGVATQLLLSTFMERPEPGISPPWLDAVGFELHEAVGLLLLSMIVGWFVWLLARRREDGPRALFPWFWIGPRLVLFGAVHRALAGARRRRMPSEEDNRVIASAVHGLDRLDGLGGDVCAR